MTFSFSHTQIDILCSPFKTNGKIILEKTLKVYEGQIVKTTIHLNLYMYFS